MGITIQAVHKNGSMFVPNERLAARQGTQYKQEGRKTLFAGNRMAKPDSIEQKREQARKQALKVVSDVFNNEKRADEALEQMAARKQELMEEAGACKARLEEIKKQREELAEVCGGEPDDLEKEELELLRKERDDEMMQRRDPNYVSQLTEEERARLKEIHNKGLTDYQKGMLELDALDAQAKSDAQRIWADQNAILSISQAMSDAVIDSLKEHPMVDASKTAEQIMQAANKEIYADLMAEGKEHIDKKIEEEKKKAEKKEKEKEEEEEKLEKLEEREEQMEEMIEKARAEAEGREAEVKSHQKKHSQEGPKFHASDIETMSSYNQEQPSTDKELENILFKLKLIEDDLKGALVDVDI